MKTNWSLVLLLIAEALIVCSSRASAQQLPKGTLGAVLPNEYKYPRMGLEVPIKKESGKVPMIVYSDRDENQTFVNATGSSPKKQVQFMDAFYVIEESGTYYHIVKCDNAVRQGVLGDFKKQIPVSAEDDGWIDKRKLLLWSRCLYSDPEKIAIKGLAVAKDPNVLANIKNYVGDDNEIKVYNHPDASKDYVSTRQSVRLAQFLFIYKDDGNSYLVGKAAQFDFNSRDYILGWVSKDIVVKWADRVCYEPNWEQGAVEERKLKKIKASLFASAEDASKFYNDGKTSVQAELDDDPYENRAPAQEKRLPVLEIPDKDGIIKTGFVTAIYDSVGNKKLESGEYSQLEKVGYAKYRGEIKKVNIVFLVDADPALNDYNRKAVDAIIHAKNLIEDLNSGNTDITTIGFGAAVYHSRCNNEESSAEKKDIATNTDDIISWLQSKIGTSETCTQTNRKALYDGIEKAVSLFGGSRTNQTNYLVIVGSAADTENVEQRQRIINKLAETLQGVLVFQVTSSQAAAYQDFIPQVTDLIRGCALKIFSDIKSDPDLMKKLGSNAVLFKKPEFKQSTGTLSMNRLDVGFTSAIDATVLNARAGKAFNTDLFSRALDTVTQTASRMAVEGSQEFDANILGFQKGVQLSQRFLRYLQRIGKTETEFRANMGNLLSTNYQVFDPAFFKPEMEGLNNAVYKPVLLMTLGEVASLDNLLQNFRDVGDQEDTRKLFIEAFKKIAQAYHGSQEVNDEELSEKTLAEIFGMMGSVESKTKISGVLTNIKYSQIDDKKHFKPEQFQELVDYLTRKKTALHSYYQDPSREFMLIDDACFWLPQELLP